MDSLTIYNAARRDMKTNATPYRNDEGMYQFTPGQLSILNQPEFQKVALLSLGIDHYNSKARSLRKETIAYQAPAENIISQIEKYKTSRSPEIEEELDNLKILKAELKQYEDDVVDMGIIPEEKPIDTNQEKTSDKPQKNNKINRKAIVSFILTWAAGEVFMTYTQFNNLRYDKAIEGIIARSIGFAVVLFLVHWVAHKQRQHRKTINTVFLVFSFLMISIMLFGPLALNQFYPEGKGPSIKEKWSIDTSTGDTVTPTTPAYPAWVEMLRHNDMMPAVLVFLFFLVMTSLSRKQKKDNKEALPLQQPPPADPVQDEVTRTRNYYKLKIRNSEARLMELQQAEKSSQKPVEDSLYNMCKVLKEKEQEEVACTEQRDKLVAERRALLNELLTELKTYQVQLKKAIIDNPGMNTKVTVDWCTEDDAVHYYKLKLQ